MKRPYAIPGVCLLVGALTAACIPAVTAAQDSEASIVQTMVKEAEALKPLVKSGAARGFLAQVPQLPVPSNRTVFYNKDTRDALTASEASERSAEQLEGYEERNFEPGFYYTTKYGSPLAFVRALDLIGQAGLMNVEGKRIADFGFGSIGQLRLLAQMGAHTVGVDVDPLLKALYSRPEDTGEVARRDGEAGSVSLAIGSFPAEDEVRRQVGTGVSLFISKNTLKNGYIHPAEEVDPRMLVHLGVSDSVFVRSVYESLEPGGYFMIYNLCPPQSEDRYIPWADGRSPFARELLESTGFEVLAYNVNDDAAARSMGRALGWDASMDLEKDLFGIYTLARKK